ncbi:amidohydrolase family protein [Maledivibacter halophilus]|uniref:Guanine deaminase n=1 Tax=Maledivibacter halophilus TaxID=36842 RepID=A0A1T5MTR5_9FIRM|nr:amidohydrolase family protein [Maledivibacter halophilus]SKC91627.1 guanine deaminase [Maledivibacter halophilus]
MNETLVLKGNIIFTKNTDKFEIYNNAFIVSIDGKVKGIYKELPKEYSNCKIRNYGNKLIIPSFVDLHLHASQFLQCGMGMTKQLLEWLNDYTFDLEKEFQNEEFAKEVYTKFADKLVDSGTLRACIFASSSTKGTEILFEILKKKGIGAYIGKVNMDRNAPNFIIESTEESIKGTEYLIKKYKNEKLVKPIITPRFAPTSTDELLEKLGELTKEYSLPVQSHLSENINEINWVKELFPDSKYYLDVYDKYYLFGHTKTAMAHGIHLSDEELNIIKGKNVILVHCPDSNINVRSGIMPLRKYLNMGIPIGLGSDIAGGHKIALNEAMVRAIQLSKLLSINNPEYKPLTIPEVFYLGTKGGGNFFGKTGSFEEGYLFDALVIEDDKLIADRYSLEDRLERFLYLGDDRNIIARYVEGKEIKQI